MTPNLEPASERGQTRAAPCPGRALVNGRQGTAQDLLGLLGALGTDPAPERSICVEFRRLPAQATLFREGTPAEALHIVRTGTFKCCRTDADPDVGERVLGFAQRGDVLGYAALGRGRHTSAAVALEPSSVAVLPLANLFACLQRLPALERALHQALSLQHARADELSDVRAVVRAEVRLARFLLHWSHRMAISGQSMHQLKLSMSRRDIGRLLGVAHETVSRSFASLVAFGCVAVTGRTVEILDAAALEDAARSTFPTTAMPAAATATGRKRASARWPDGVAPSRDLVGARPASRQAAFGA